MLTLRLKNCHVVNERIYNPKTLVECHRSGVNLLKNNIATVELRIKNENKNLEKLFGAVLTFEGVSSFLNFNSYFMLFICINDKHYSYFILFVFFLYQPTIKYFILLDYCLKLSSIILYYDVFAALKDLKR